MFLGLNIYFALCSLQTDAEITMINNQSCSYLCSKARFYALGGSDNNRCIRDDSIYALISWHVNCIQLELQITSHPRTPWVLSLWVMIAQKPTMTDLGWRCRPFRCTCAQSTVSRYHKKPSAQVHASTAHAQDHTNDEYMCYQEKGKGLHKMVWVVPPLSTSFGVEFFVTPDTLASQLS
ncbi:hypothetical protein B0O80DRAFT_137666 [Mortierella sp. GBAus27b]|nr:hypothetical protein B0O80DRAFT_137666 [Mortierella sp. GBAus27b]